MKTQKQIFALLVVTILVRSPIQADEISIFDMPDFGANADALAGPLFGSDTDIDEFTGPVVGTAMAMLGDNTAIHSYAFETDFSTSPAFLDSTYDLTRSSITGERASAESLMYFMVDVPVTYDVMGLLIQVCGSCGCSERQARVLNSLSDEVATRN